MKSLGYGMSYRKKRNVMSCEYFKAKGHNQPHGQLATFSNALLPSPRRYITPNFNNPNADPDNPLSSILSSRLQFPFLILTSYPTLEPHCYLCVLQYQTSVSHCLEPERLDWEYPPAAPIPCPLYPIPVFNHIFIL